ncbi:MAG: helicase C-terminal domain-containing protein, partial [Verrucomicrobiota bacterium]|nr:helicase C-terminal domain-containing protein [Verrucomicrobiota bacterium]
FGIHVSSYSVDRALKRLYNPLTKGGILKKNGSQWDLNAVDEAIVACREFFAHIGEVILCKKPIQRIYEPNFCDNIISQPLKEVAERIAVIVQKIDDELMQDELKDHRSRILSYQDTINGFIKIAEDNHVYWIERGGKNGQIVTLRSAPLNVAPALREALFSRHTGAVLTSATLSNGQNMDSYQSKVGGDGAETQIESSPFNYNKNCSIYIATDSPLPEPGAGRLDLDYLSNMITWCSRHQSGGSLVLFTSHFDLRKVRERTEAFFKKIKRPLFCQGYESSRSELIRKFQNSSNGILFGTDSYWTGIDIPGPALSQVIIARLPFENPNHPVSEARNEYINSLGGNPFNDLIIPEALVRFRQGMGRLIRRHEDRGSIVILDSRIVSKPYGRQFIEALPTREYKRFNRHNRESIFISPSTE